MDIGNHRRFGIAERPVEEAADIDRFPGRIRFNQRGSEYTGVGQELLKPEADQQTSLAIKAAPNPPDTNQTRRGTTISRWWSGDKAPIVGSAMTCDLFIQREPDQPGAEDEPVPFGVAITLQMPGIVQIYDQVRQRLGLRLPVR